MKTKRMPMTGMHKMNPVQFNKMALHEHMAGLHGMSSEMAAAKGDENRAEDHSVMGEAHYRMAQMHVSARGENFRSRRTTPYPGDQ